MRFNLNKESRTSNETWSHECKSVLWKQSRETEEGPWPMLENLKEKRAEETWKELLV